MAALPNIYIIGSQSTGKTTLVNDLSKYFEHHPLAVEEPPGIIKEVARTILANYGFTRGDIRSSKDRTLQLQRLIIKGQFEAEESELETRSWFISDRSAVDPVVYARKYASREGADALITSARWVEMRNRMAKSLIIVCEAGVDWLADDGVRLMPLDSTEWMQTHSEFCDTLANIGLEYHVLPSKIGCRDERAKFILARWERKRRELTPASDQHEHVKGNYQCKKSAPAT
ncbi:AAA domain-containing protein [Xylaria telfairii]|nr:AAA domain-containing protein [Xylaria telfairii]